MCSLQCSVTQLQTYITECVFRYLLFVCFLCFFTTTVAPGGHTNFQDQISWHWLEFEHKLTRRPLYILMQKSMHYLGRNISVIFFACSIIHSFRPCRLKPRLDTIQQCNGLAVRHGLATYVNSNMHCRKRNESTQKFR